MQVPARHDRSKGDPVWLIRKIRIRIATRISRGRGKALTRNQAKIPRRTRKTRAALTSSVSKAIGRDHRAIKAALMARIVISKADKAATEVAIKIAELVALDPNARCRICDAGVPCTNQSPEGLSTSALMPDHAIH